MSPPYQGQTFPSLAEAQKVAMSAGANGQQSFSNLPAPGGSNGEFVFFGLRILVWRREVGRGGWIYMDGWMGELELELELDERYRTLCADTPFLPSPFLPFFAFI